MMTHVQNAGVGQKESDAPPKAAQLKFLLNNVGGVDCACCPELVHNCAVQFIFICRKYCNIILSLLINVFV